MRVGLIMILCVYIFVMVGKAWRDIGETSPESIFPAWLPIMVFVVVTFPAMLGFLIGRIKDE